MPIEIVSLTPQERLDRFDKMFNEVFKKFTGYPWSLVGSLDSPQQAVANTLLRMYRETRAEDMFVLDELKPVTF